MRMDCKTLLLLAGLLGLVGCLPEWDEAPLTATGEAGDDEKPTGGSGSTVKCSGEYAGTIQANNNGTDIAVPCVVGSVDIRTEPSDVTLPILRGIKTIKGTLRIKPGTPLTTYLPALTSIGSLEVSGLGGGDLVLDIPAKFTSLGTLSLKSTNVIAITGGAGITALPGGLQLDDNKDIQSISAFAKVATAGDIILRGLAMLTEFTAFGSLKTVRSIELNHVAVLTALPTFAVEEVTDAIVVSYCDNLKAIESFPKVKKLNRLQIDENRDLSKIDFPALTEVNYFNLARNDGITTMGFADTKVTTTFQICLKSVSCAERQAWIAKNAPTANEGKCQPITDMCF